MSNMPKVIVNSAPRTTSKITVNYEDVDDLENKTRLQNGIQGYIPFVDNKNPNPDKLYISNGLGVQITNNEQGQPVLNTLITKLTNLQGGPVESYGYNVQPNRHDHLITKRYVDTLARGLDHKQNCKLTDKIDLRLRLKKETIDIDIDGFTYNFVAGAALDANPESDSSAAAYYYETTKPSYFLIKKDALNTQLVPALFTDRNHRFLIRYGILNDHDDANSETLLVSTSSSLTSTDTFHWHRDTTHKDDGNAAITNGIYNVIFSTDPRITSSPAISDWCIVHRTLDFDLGYDVIGAYTTVEKNVDGESKSGIDTTGKAFYVFSPGENSEEFIAGEVIVGVDKIHFTVSHGIDYNQGTNIVIEKDTNRISVTDDVFLQGTFQVQGTTRLQGALNVQGTTNLQSSTTLQDALTVQGITNLQDDATFKKALNVQGTTNLQSSTILQNALTVQGTTNLQGAVKIKETLDVQHAYIQDSLQIPVLPIGQTPGNMCIFFDSGLYHLQFSNSTGDHKIAFG